MSVRKCNPYEPDFMACAGLEPPARRWNPYLSDLPAEPSLVVTLAPPDDLVPPPMHTLQVQVEDEMPLALDSGTASPTAVAEPAPFLLVLIAAAAFGAGRVMRRSA
ncbi:hypothetical protein [Luteitalea sp.]